MHGKVKEMGVHASDPNTEINLSKLSFKERQKTTVNKTITARNKFFNHILFLDFSMFLNR